MNIATYSIVAYDSKRKEWGVAVQSKFMGVGAIVPFAEANSGVVATQAFANYQYGPIGLKLMRAGMNAEDVIHELISNDFGKDDRQVGVVDRHGKSATFTGEKCMDWAGGISGKGFAVQGNILIPGTVEAMAIAFEIARQGEGELSDWLVEALGAAQDAGGDKRGRQSASVLVVRENGGYGGNNDRYLDLRVDDHSRPIKELGRLLDMHHLFFGQDDLNNRVILSEIAGELQQILQRQGCYFGKITAKFDQATKKAFEDFCGIENLEERWTGVEDSIDVKVWNYIQNRFVE